MTREEFIAALPAFKNVEADAVQAELDAANPIFTVATWGDFYTVGLSNYVGFWLVQKGFLPASAPNLAQANDITDKQVGAVRVGRSAAIIQAKMENPFMNNQYGQTYWFYAQRVGRGAIAV